MASDLFNKSITYIYLLYLDILLDVINIFFFVFSGIIRPKKERRERKKKTLQKGETERIRENIGEE